MNKEVKQMMKDLDKVMLHELFHYSDINKLGITDKAELFCEESLSKGFTEEARILYGVCKVMIWVQENSEFDDMTHKDWWKELFKDYSTLFIERI